MLCTRTGLRVRDSHLLKGSLPPIRLFACASAPLPVPVLRICVTTIEYILTNSDLDYDYHEDLEVPEC